MYRQIARLSAPLFAPLCGLASATLVAPGLTNHHHHHVYAFEPPR